MKSVNPSKDRGHLQIDIASTPPAGDAGDVSPAIFGQPGTKCLRSPPKFVKIVIKLPAERCNQRLRYKQDTQTFKERVIVLILQEL